MKIQYMDDGFAPHVDRGLKTAMTRLEPDRPVGDQGGETAQHSRALVEHILDKRKGEGPSRLSGPGTSGKF